MFAIQNKLSKFYIRQYHAEVQNCSVTKDIDLAQKFSTKAEAKTFVKNHSDHGIPTASAIFVEIKDESVELIQVTELVQIANKPETISSVVTRLILAGKTNAEVWAVIKEQFKLDDSKKGYPSWYRNQLKKKGSL